MTTTWRLLDTGPMTAAENIALDRALLTSRSRNHCTDTLRLIQFAPHCVLVGYHQDQDEEVRVPYCSRHGIHMNRRITGGGAVYIDTSQVCFEVVASFESVGTRSLDHLYRKVSSVCVEALRTLGVDAAFRPRNDIEVSGRKISGTGGTSEGDAFLFQGTLLVRDEIATMVRALRIPVEKLERRELASIRERVAFLEDLSAGPVPPARIKAALANACTEVFGVRLEPGGLVDEEERLFSSFLPEVRTEDWRRQVRSSPGSAGTLDGVVRAFDGGVLSVVCRYTSGGVISQVRFTGDFFLSPHRALLDLEARLRDVTLAEAREIVPRHLSSHCQMLSTSPGDFTALLDQLAQKVELLEAGFSFEEVSSLFPVTTRFSLRNAAPVQAILLPYCAKAVECGFRHRHGCEACGGCTVSEVYRRYADTGVHLRSVSSFEDLMDALRELRRRGVSSWAGCCCRAFYARHQHEISGFGLPGLLVGVDSTTCYDLKRERDAYLGRFDGRTELKLDLLFKVLGMLGVDG